MTEYDLALDFLQTYVPAATAAAEDGGPPDRGRFDGGREFRRHCDGLGVAATDGRLDLVRDLAGVIRDCVLRGEDVPADAAGPADARFVPGGCLVDGLERHGWRPAFLAETVTG